MTGNLQGRLSSLMRPGLAARAAVLLVCALIMCCTIARPVIAQSSRLRAAFEDADKDDSAASESWPGAIKLAGGQQQPPAKPAKTTPPPARKPMAKKASPAAVTKEKQAPVIMEELPAGPMKAVCRWRAQRLETA